MKPQIHLLRASLLACAAALALPAVAHADQIEKTYQQDRANCMNGNTNEDRSTCLKEAAAARAEARRGGLTTPSPQALASAADRRCQVQPLQDREDCIRRNQDGIVVAQGVRESDSITISPAAGPAKAKPATSTPKR
jgi:hypothetical protein